MAETTETCRLQDHLRGTAERREVGEVLSVANEAELLPTCLGHLPVSATQVEPSGRRRRKRFTYTVKP
jgi:hypothetical protein